MPAGGIPSTPDVPAADGTPFVLGDFCIDEYRQMKVIVMGAGYSGITAVIRYVDVEWLELKN